MAPAGQGRGFQPREGFCRVGQPGESQVVPWGKGHQPPWASDGLAEQLSLIKHQLISRLIALCFLGIWSRDVIAKDQVD